MKLEVGMYVRTKKGSIAKLLEFEKNYTKGKRKIDTYMIYEVWEVKEHYVRFDKSFVSNNYDFLPSYPSDEEWKKWKSNILKASYNIIDLIEVGDFVNGCYVKEIVINDDEKLLFVDCDSEQLSVIGDGLITICEVLTHEQYEANAYKVGE